MVRVSGPRAVQAAGLLVSGRAEGSAAAAERANLRARPRELRLRWLTDPTTGARLDRALVVYMPRNASATGEDVVEFHLHGGPAVLSGVLSTLGRAEGLRPAVPGEFTRRAMKNGKVRDLVQAEALADLTRSETQAQVQLALARLGDDRGAGPLYLAWRERTVRAQAHAEALIDFSDDVNFAGMATGGRAQERARRLPPAASAEMLAEQVAALVNELDGHLIRDARASELIRSGLRAALVGLPNSGKSSVANALVGRHVSIVSPQKGTTRDVVEAHLAIAGAHVILSDTAGISGAPRNDIEAEAERRAQLTAAGADVVLHVVDLHAIVSSAGRDSLDALLRDVANRGRAITPDALDVIVVLNKSDLVGDADVLAKALATVREGGAGCLSSCVSVGGLDAVRGELARAAAASLGERSPADVHAAVANPRQRTHLERMRAALVRALAPDPSGLPSPEIAAEELRAAAAELDALLGVGPGVDGVLDAVFAEFCIGK